MVRYFDVFCIVPVSAQLMTSSVKNLSQQNIRAAGSTAAVSLAQVSFTFLLSFRLPESDTLIILFYLSNILCQCM